MLKSKTGLAFAAFFIVVWLFAFYQIWAAPTGYGDFGTAVLLFVASMPWSLAFPYFSGEPSDSYVAIASGVLVNTVVVAIFAYKFSASVERKAGGSFRNIPAGLVVTLTIIGIAALYGDYQIWQTEHTPTPQYHDAGW
ncbi:MAG TPA: hypothetical protein VJL57_01180 [Candidatus Paceibacterota bacterium]